MPNMQQIAAAQASPEVPINENFESVEHVAVYAKNPDTTTGLTWGYLGGRWGGTAITAGTVTLTDAATNYVVVHRGTGAVSVSTSATNWDDWTTYARLYQLTTAGSVVTAVQDHRTGPAGALWGGLRVGVIGNYADDSAAASGGVAVGQVYRNGSVLQVRVA